MVTQYHRVFGSEIGYQTFALVDEIAIWGISLEEEDGAPFDPASAGGRPIVLEVRFNPSLEVTWIEGGEPAGEEPDGAPHHWPRNDDR